MSELNSPLVNFVFNGTETISFFDLSNFIGQTIFNKKLNSYVGRVHKQCFRELLSFPTLLKGRKYIEREDCLKVNTFVDIHLFIYYIHIKQYIYF